MAGNKVQLIQDKPVNKRERDRFVFHFMDLLTAPILTHSAAWKDSIPPRLIKEITMQRLVSAMRKEEMATLAETVAFIMTRTFDAPMDHDWTQIYLWCSCTVCQECWGEDHWDTVFGRHDYRHLNDYQQGLLKHLRIWIYNKRRQHVKTKDIQDGRFSSAPAYFNDLNKKEDECQQESLLRAG